MEIKNDSTYELNCLKQRKQYLEEKLWMSETIAERSQYDTLLTQIEAAIEDLEHVQ